MFLKYVTDMFLFCFQSSRLFYFGSVILTLLTTSAFGGSPARSSGIAQPVKTLMIFGDSLTAGYGVEEKNSFSKKLSGALKRKGINVTIILSSVSGDTTAGGSARIDWALADKPDAVLLELGANDGLRGIDPKISRKNLEFILKKLAKHRVRTLLAGMLAPPNLGKEYTKEFNNIYSSLAEKYNILFYPFFLEGVATKPQLNQTDGIHPNPKGVDEIVKRILPLVIKLVK
jgi:acyl-CoA thioesterase-1